jgi:formiminotetrahydrofolate cyclodeaminase
VAAALAAGLAAMAARFASDEWERRPHAVGRAEELRALLEPLADADAQAYAAFVAEQNEETRARIVEVPRQIGEAAAEVAALAAEVAADGNPNVRGDAAAAADLAAAAASIAARLVLVNAGRSDERTTRAAEAADAAAVAAARADAADD